MLTYEVVFHIVFSSAKRLLEDFNFGLQFLWMASFVLNYLIIYIMLSKCCTPTNWSSTTLYFLVKICHIGHWMRCPNFCIIFYQKKLKNLHNLSKELECKPKLQYTNKSKTFDTHPKNFNTYISGQLLSGGQSFVTF